jgi:hypothetical protein
LTTLSSRKRSLDERRDAGLAAIALGAHQESAWRRTQVEASLATYLKTYEKRQRKGASGHVFSSAEQNAMTALLLLRAAEAGLPSFSLPRALERVETLTRDPLAKLLEHSVVTDIAGYIWACSFGTLPLDKPPLREVEWALESGRGSGSVRGVFGVAWRCLFLAAAWPYIRFPHRREAGAELRRRLDHLRQRAVEVAEGATPNTVLRPYERARFALFLGELGTRVDNRLSVTAHRLLHLAVGSDDSSTPGLAVPEGLTETAHLAQLALAADIVGEQGLVTSTVDSLLVRRKEGEYLLQTSSEPGARFELSPWVPLALLAARRHSSPSGVPAPRSHTIA